MPPSYVPHNIVRASRPKKTVHLESGYAGQKKAQQVSYFRFRIYIIYILLHEQVYYCTISSTTVSFVYTVEVYALTLFLSRCLMVLSETFFLLHLCVCVCISLEDVDRMYSKIKITQVGNRNRFKRKAFKNHTQFCGVSHNRFFINVAFCGV